MVKKKTKHIWLSGRNVQSDVNPQSFDKLCVFFSCQNWEGGLGGMPGLEAHGGYTFCGMAALVILGKEHMLDLKALLVSLSLSHIITHDALFLLSLHINISETEDFSLEDLVVMMIN